MVLCQDFLSFDAWILSILVFSNDCIYLLISWIVRNLDVLSHILSAWLRSPICFIRHFFYIQICNRYFIQDELNFNSSKKIWIIQQVCIFLHVMSSYALVNWIFTIFTPLKISLVCANVSVSPICWRLYSPMCTSKYHHKTILDRNNFILVMHHDLKRHPCRDGTFYIRWLSLCKLFPWRFRAHSSLEAAIQL